MAHQPISSWSIKLTQVDEPSSSIMLVINPDQTWCVIKSDQLFIKLDQNVSSLIRADEFIKLRSTWFIKLTRKKGFTSGQGRWYISSPLGRNWVHIPTPGAQTFRLRKKAKAWDCKSNIMYIFFGFYTLAPPAWDVEKHNRGGWAQLEYLTDKLCYSVLILPNCYFQIPNPGISVYD